MHYRNVKDPTWTSKVYADVKDAGFDDKESLQKNAFRMKDLTKEGKPLSENYAERSPIGLPTWYIDNGASVLGQYYTDKKRLAHHGEHAQRIFAKAFARSYFPFYAETKQHELDDYDEPDALSRTGQKRKQAPADHCRSKCHYCKSNQCSRTKGHKARKCCCNDIGCYADASEDLSDIDVPVLDK